MATRTIALGVVSYVDAQGLHQFGQLGQEVDVHGDDLERFDRLNVFAGATPPVAVDVEPVALAPDSDPAADPGEPHPLDGMKLAELRDYAAQKGINLDGVDARKVDAIRAAIVAAEA